MRLCCLVNKDRDCYKCGKPICRDHSIDIGGSGDWGSIACPECAAKQTVYGMLVFGTLLAIITVLFICRSL